MLMRSMVERIGAQILREARLSEKVSPQAAELVNRQIGTAGAVSLSMLLTGLILHFLEVAQAHPDVTRNCLSAEAFQALLILLGSGLVITGYFPVAFGSLYRIWVERRVAFAPVAAATLAGIAYSPSMGLGLISLAPLVTMALRSPSQMVEQASCPAGSKRAAPKRRRRKGSN